MRTSVAPNTSQGFINSQNALSNNIMMKRASFVVIEQNENSKMYYMHDYLEII